VINGWGNCPPSPSPCPADVAPRGVCAQGGDGVVNVNDLLLVINLWGSNCATGAFGGGMPQFVSDCWNDVCSGLSGESWQKCMDSCIATVCENNPRECE
jgi:hypothetical protein